MALRFFISLFLFVFPVLATAQQATWEPPYEGDDPTLLYLPDTKATYWRYGWKRKPGDRDGIVIKGQMPDARYFSYNVYDDNTKSSLGSFTDFELLTDNGDMNPFSGEIRNTHPTYTIHVLPEGTKTNAKNVLYFPDRLTKVSVFLRHYLANTNIGGGVPVPSVAIFDPSSGVSKIASKSTNVPALSKQEAQKYLVPMFKQMIADFEENPKQMLESLEKTLESGSLDLKEIIASQVIGKAFNLFKPTELQKSLRLQTAGTYPNKDNYYLGLPIIRSKDQALLVRFKAPEKPNSFSDYPNAQVRYFSLSQGDEKSYTLQTISDEEMLIDDSGFVNFIIANETPGAVAKAKALNVNFMPWLTGDKMLLIYRHMLPAANFKNGIDKVASFHPQNPIEDQYATNAIGEYALVGRFISEQEILNLKTFPEF